MAFGANEAPDILRDWGLANPLLPLLGPLVAQSFPRPYLNGVKLLFGCGGQDIAEVRVNGEYHEAASEYLRSLSWPRSASVAFARCYLLFVHPGQD